MVKLAGIENLRRLAAWIRGLILLIVVLYYGALLCGVIAAARSAWSCMVSARKKKC